MQKWRSFLQAPFCRCFILASIAGLYWVWWDSFHEIGRFFIGGYFLFGATPVLTSYLSCACKPAGVVIGCLVLSILLRRQTGFLGKKYLPATLLAVNAVLHFLYYLAISAQLLVVTCIIYAIISAFAMPGLLIIALQMKCLNKREIIYVVIGCIAYFGFFNNLLFPSVLISLPPLVITFVYFAILITAYALSRSFSKQNLASIEPGRESQVRTPAPLFVHLIIYGLAFGVLHALGGFLSASPYILSLPIFYASLITIACLAFLYLKKSSNYEIWSKIRSAVFPLSIIGYLLLPLASNSAVAIALTESGNLLYTAILILGCFTLIRESYVDSRTIVLNALLFKNIGTLIGIILVHVAYDNVFLEFIPQGDSFIYNTLPVQNFFEGSAYSTLSVTIVFLLTIATFWVGSDAHIKKMWGLRKSLSPKMYNDLVLKKKCNLLTEDHRLTTREAEILLLLVQGQRASDIKDNMNVSMDTVRSHIKHLYAKLNVHSLAELTKLLKNTKVDDPIIEE